jgi:hypothetical protein
MAYEKNTWARGDIVTSAKLNHMEDGIANAGRTLVIGGFRTDDNGSFVGTSDKTWQEIHDALVAGKECISIIQDGDSVYRVVLDSARYSAGTSEYIISGEINAECNSPDGYPTTASGDES